MDALVVGGVLGDRNFVACRVDAVALSGLDQFDALPRGFGLKQQLLCCLVADAGLDVQLPYELGLLSGVEVVDPGGR